MRIKSICIIDIPFFLGGAVSFPLKVSLPPSGATNYDRTGPFKAKRNTQQRGHQSFSWEKKKGNSTREKRKKLVTNKIGFFFSSFGKENNSTNKTKRKQSCAHVIIKKGRFLFLAIDTANRFAIWTSRACYYFDSPFWVMETRNLFGGLYIVWRWIKFQNRRLCIIITKELYVKCTKEFLVSLNSVLCKEE